MTIYKCERCLYTTAQRNKYLQHQRTKKHLLNSAEPVEVVAEVVVEEAAEEVEEAAEEVEDDWETKYNALLIEHNALKQKERALNAIVRSCLAYIY
jgi:hypothetical protein